MSVIVLYFFNKLPKYPQPIFAKASNSFLKLFFRLDRRLLSDGFEVIRTVRPIGQALVNLFIIVGFCYFFVDFLLHLSLYASFSEHLLYRLF